MRTSFCNSERYALRGNLKSVSAAENNTRAAEKGFSLLETVISMTVITIVFAMAVSSMLFVSTTLKKTDNQRFFTNEAANFLECYKVEGSAGFAKNANEFFFGSGSGVGSGGAGSGASEGEGSGSGDGSGGAGSGASDNEGSGGDANGVSSIVAPETGGYTVLIGYDSDFNRQIIATYGAGENIPESAYRQKYFTLVITIDKSFGCVVFNFKGSVLFDGGKFYSRYDL